MYLLILATLMSYTSHLFANEDRPVLKMTSKAAEITVDLGGGSIADFHLGKNGLNPLQWDSWDFSETPDDDPPLTPRSMGHFLCLDRWGPATPAEIAHGMGWHGEATTSWWSVTKAPIESGRFIEAQMMAKLPLAGLEVVRKIQLHKNEAIFKVDEAVKNTRHIGRIYNIVQHPTIGPPFLDETTVVDANGTRGFMQETPAPHFEKPEVLWPFAMKKDGTKVNMRHLKNDATPAVVSYIIEDKYGWTTAVNAKQQLLIGYIWPSKDYPWFDAWRHVAENKPFARGLEFGTTGLHQPGPVLVEKGKIFDRHIFKFIDADETQLFSYANFLMKVPRDFGGVKKIEYKNGKISVTERGAKTRNIVMNVGDLFDDRKD